MKTNPYAPMISNPMGYGYGFRQGQIGSQQLQAPQAPQAPDSTALLKQALMAKQSASNVPGLMQRSRQAFGHPDKGVAVGMGLGKGILAHLQAKRGKEADVLAAKAKKQALQEERDRVYQAAYELALSQGATPDQAKALGKAAANNIKPADLLGKATKATGTQAEYDALANIYGPEKAKEMLSTKYQEDVEEGPGFKEAATIRTEYRKETEEFAKQTNSFARVQASAKNPSAAGDLSMIFNYMKILDPNSVVRESEFATAAASGSFGQRIQAAGARLAEGERLSDEMRNDFANRAAMLYEQAIGLYQGRREEYHDLSRRMGLDPDKILIDRQVLDTGLGEGESGAEEDGIKVVGRESL